MGADELKKRTKAFAISIIELVQMLPGRGPAYVINNQLLRCGTSVGANFRSAGRAWSHADFIAKLKIVEEECDESIYWLERLDFLNPAIVSLIQGLVHESNQILSIIVASIKTARKSS
jgi:four helix bundle protein